MWSNQENRVRKQVKNPCEARKIKASQILHKEISTHLLTVLTIRCIVIVSVEQTKHAFRYDHKISEVINNTDYDNNVRYFHVFEAAWSKVIER